MEKEEILSVDQYTNFLVPASSYNMQDDNRLLIPFTSGDKIGFVDKEGAIVVKPQFTMYYDDCYDESDNIRVSDIYQCRNMNHRGNTLNEWEQSTLNRISPLKSFYYFKFMGVLAQYVDYIRNGFDYIPELKKYSDSIKEKKCPLLSQKY